MKTTDTITIIAKSSHVNCPPRKANLVLKSLKGLSPQQAQDLLTFTPKRATIDIIKLIKQATGNASDQHKLAPEQLIIDQAYATKAKAFKQIRYGGRGRVKPYQKVRSHFTLILKPTVDTSSSPQPTPQKTQKNPKPIIKTNKKTTTITKTKTNKN